MTIDEGWNRNKRGSLFTMTVHYSDHMTADADQSSHYILMRIVSKTLRYLNSFTCNIESLPTQRQQLVKPAELQHLQKAHLI